MQHVRALAAIALLATGCSALLDIDSFSEGAATCVDCGDGVPPIARADGDGGTPSGAATTLPPEGGESTPPPLTEMPDGATGPVTYCSSVVATFCADFDTLPLPSGFGTNDGTFLRLATDRRVSEPNALLVDVPAATGTAVNVSRLTRVFTQEADRVELAFDILPEKVNTDTNARAMLAWAVDFKTTTGTLYSIRMVFVFGQVRVEEHTSGGPADVYHPLFTIPAAEWSRYSIAISLQNGTFEQTLNGTTTSRTLRVPASLDRRPTLMAGAVYGPNPQNGWKFYLDNLVFDLK